MNETVIFAFAGPSGSGKSELIQRLLADYPEMLLKWKQTTTRARRSANDDYVFITKEQYVLIEGMLTVRTTFNGNHYGTFIEARTAADPVQGILTIASREGLEDLETAVKFHNECIADGRSGCFGDIPARVVRVLMKYDITPESVARRGREMRGTEFIQSEINDLLDIGAWDIVIDTTEAWPDVEQTFNEHIWPVLDALRSDPAVQLRIDIRQWMQDTERLLDTMPVPTMEILWSKLPKHVKYAMAAKQVVDDVDAALMSAAKTVAEPTPAMVRAMDDGVNYDVDVEEDPIDVLSTSFEQALETGEPTAIEAPELEAFSESAKRAMDDGVNYEADSESEAPRDFLADSQEQQRRHNDMYNEMLEAGELGEFTEEEAPAAEAEAAPTSAVRTPTEIFASADFETFVLETGVGKDAFENENVFKTIFSQYISSYQGDPNGIIVASQATADGKGGRVVEYIAVMPDGSRYACEFNFRLMRMISHGPRAA